MEEPVKTPPSHARGFQRRTYNHRIRSPPVIILLLYRNPLVSASIARRAELAWENRRYGVHLVPTWAGTSKALPR